jgi:hypothetical protein
VEFLLDLAPMLSMSGGTPPLPDTPSWRNADLCTRGALRFQFTNDVCNVAE